MWDDEIKKDDRWKLHRAEVLGGSGIESVVGAVKKIEG